MKDKTDKTDAVNHPAHYAQAASALEPIDVLRYAPFCLGNALKYIIRAGYKDDEKQDLLKARFYIEDCLKDDGFVKKDSETFFCVYGRILGTFDRLSGLSSLSDVSNRISRMLTACETGAFRSEYIHNVEQKQGVNDSEGKQQVDDNSKPYSKYSYDYLNGCTIKHNCKPPKRAMSYYADKDEVAKILNLKSGYQLLNLTSTGGKWYKKFPVPEYVSRGGRIKSYWNKDHISAFVASQNKPQSEMGNKQLELTSLQ